MNEQTPVQEGARVRVFIDYWNFQLSLNHREAEDLGQEDSRFKIDWQKFPQWVAGQGASVAGISRYQYEGAIIYASYNPNTEADRKLKKWLETWLNRQPGIQLDLRERQWKDPPRCPSCHEQINDCPHCKTPISATVEKGVDAAIVTDMIRLAWENVYDLAIIVSSDRDLVPAVKFIDLKGRKVIQAGFPPSGLHLATACWASFDLFPLREQFRRP